MLGFSRWAQNCYIMQRILHLFLFTPLALPGKLPRRHAAVVNILYLFLLFPPLLSAQITYFGPTVGMSSTIYQFDTPVSYPGTSGYFEWRKDHSKNDYLLGAEMTRSVQEHWEIRLGARFATSGYAQEDFQGFIEIDNTMVPLATNRLIVNHFFLEVPLAARYVFLSKKWSPYAEAGVCTNTYLTTRVSERISNEPNRFWERNAAVYPMNLRGEMALGVQVKSFQGRICWFGQFTGRVQLLQIEKDTRNPGLDFAMETGCRFRLKA